MARDVRASFDRSADFVVARPFIAAGRRFEVGDQFDKSLCDARRLRQMYDLRQLKQLPKARPTRPVAPTETSAPTARPARAATKPKADKPAAAAAPGRYRSRQSA